MKKTKIKHLGIVSAAAAMLLFSGCTPAERAVATGVAAAVIVNSFDYPRYQDRPYYYYNNRYYYGGEYRNGYYYYKGHKYRGGQYYRYYDKRNHPKYDRYNYNNSYHQKNVNIHNNTKYVYVNNTQKRNNQTRKKIIKKNERYAYKNDDVQKQPNHNTFNNLNQKNIKNTKDYKKSDDKENEKEKNRWSLR